MIDYQYYRDAAKEAMKEAIENADGDQLIIMDHINNFNVLDMELKKMEIREKINAKTSKRK